MRSVECQTLEAECWTRGRSQVVWGTINVPDSPMYFDSLWQKPVGAMSAPSRVEEASPVSSEELDYGLRGLVGQMVSIFWFWLLWFSGAGAGAGSCGSQRLSEALERDGLMRARQSSKAKDCSKAKDLPEFGRLAAVCCMYHYVEWTFITVPRPVAGRRLSFLKL